MWAFLQLVDFFYWMGSTFWGIASFAGYLPFVGASLENWFEAVGDVFIDIGWQCYELYIWAYDIEGQVSTIVSWDTLKFWILGNFPILQWSLWDLLDWIRNELVWAFPIITWSVADLYNYVKGWIEWYHPILTWTPWEIVDNIWDAFVAKLESWLEVRTDWVLRVGEKTLDKMW